MQFGYHTTYSAQVLLQLRGTPPLYLGSLGDSRVGWVGSIPGVLQSMLGICSSSHASASRVVWEALYLTEHHL